ncbi:flagellar hook-length control protein FliK [Sphingomonas flavalba]|uniref:flagellar hook-length control protein FliK n=1 Tax=Sphingomonas flavalba TaxID=2559804 RepID=UPI0039E11C19
MSLLTIQTAGSPPHQPAAIPALAGGGGDFAALVAGLVAAEPVPEGRVPGKALPPDRQDAADPVAADAPMPDAAALLVEMAGAPDEAPVDPMPDTRAPLIADMPEDRPGAKAPMVEMPQPAACGWAPRKPLMPVAPPPSVANRDTAPVAVAGPSPVAATLPAVPAIVVDAPAEAMTKTETEIDAGTEILIDPAVPVAVPIAVIVPIVPFQSVQPDAPIAGAAPPVTAIIVDAADGAEPDIDVPNALPTMPDMPVKAGATGQVSNAPNAGSVQSQAAVVQSSGQSAAPVPPTAIPPRSDAAAAQALAAMVIGHSGDRAETERTTEAFAQALGGIRAGLAGAPPRVEPPVAVLRAPPLDTGRAEWIAALVDRIDAQRAEGSRIAHLKLRPDALGGVEVRIRQDGDRIHVAFATETAQARALLADAAPRLAELADARGLKLGDTGVQQQDRQAPDQRRPVDERLPDAPAPAVALTDTDATAPSGRIA